MKSHKKRLKPTILLCLICLAIVHRLRPRWVSVSVKDAARSEGVSAQRLSRLCSRSICLFEKGIVEITQKGRPRTQRNDSFRELSLLRALLQVATDVLSSLSLKKPVIRQLLVGAYLRLKEQHQGLTQQEFCRCMAVPERTLRYWLKHSQMSSTPVAEPENKEQKKEPRLRRPRFGFEVTLPGTQMGADTTDFTAFGVGLKLMASQDIGGRDQNLFESIIVDTHEDAKLVSQMLCDAIGTNKGVQLISDQGTPYLAQKTRDTLESLEADHAPQKEGDPQGKATVEKAFDTIKRIAHPLLEVTDQLAQKVQALCEPELAKSMATLLFTALLRAYQAGARATQRAQNARTGLSQDTLLELASRSRRQAHAEDRSARLLLTRVHQLYAIEQPIQSFIRNLRTFPLEVLQKAEHAFGTQAHRDDIRKRGPYFAAIVRNINAEYQNRKAQQRDEQEQEKTRRNQEQEAHQRKKAWREDPSLWLSAALEALAHQWIPAESKLLFDGRGLGLAWLKSSITRMLELFGPTTTQHLAEGVFIAFRNNQYQNIGTEGIEAIRLLLEKYLPKTIEQNTDCTKKFKSIILKTTGPPSCSGPCLNC